MASAPINTLLFGGCLIHTPLMVVLRRNKRLDYTGYGPVTPLHTFGEMFQTIDILRGKFTIPPELIHLTRLSADLAAVPAASDFRDLDLALIEPASPVELTFRGITINRMCIIKHVISSIPKSDRQALKLATAWFRQGLGNANEAVRADAAAKLVDHLPGDDESAQMRRAVVRETRAAKAKVVDGLRKMQDLLGCPIGVVVYVFQYLPDGRVLTWPLGFREEVLAAARELDLPLFEPDQLVRSFGVETAVTPDGRHYTEAFRPAVGEALVAFAESVYRDAKAKAVSPH